MASAKITLIGLSKYYSQIGKSLWDGFTLPSGIDRDVLVDSIILRGGEFEVLYADPEFYKQAINAFFRKHNRTFTKWYEALQIEYNPLENYDRLEEWNDKATGKSNDKSSGSVTNKVSAYNTSNLQTVSKDDTTASSDTSMENENIRKGRAHGNIGVTTSQQMLQSELDINAWNVYEHIADLFCDELTIMVY